ncbi:hypothetical protein ASN_3198 [Acetobacter senegalensis]|uniref:Alpha/beta hydrolase n=1 Tax=Acetobacter senegalensis TaxID=446692 RepID=A0A0U5F3B8_9PROT|nr:lysophospholipase [Acetobacter senegalensis]CEF42440.1 hypothetical protein ASN_3198 [Acetobacter senegalensis]
MWKYLPYTIVILIFCTALQGWAYAHDQSTPEPTANSVDPGMNERVIRIPLRTGGYVRAILGSPVQPKATIIMFPGGTGDIGLGQDGRIQHADNFVMRTREVWNRQGYAVLIPDTVNHLPLRGLRSSAHYAHLVEDIIAFVRRQDSGPVFLFGTS